MSTNRRAGALLRLVADNLNGLLVCAGGWSVVHGVGLWSDAAAYVVAGVLLLGLGLWPFLRRGETV